MNGVWVEDDNVEMKDQMEAMCHAALAFLTLMHFAYFEAGAHSLYDEIVALGQLKKKRDERKTVEPAKIGTRSGRAPMPRRVVDAPRQGPVLDAARRELDDDVARQGPDFDTQHQSPVAALPTAVPTTIFSQLITSSQPIISSQAISTSGPSFSR